MDGCRRDTQHTRARYTTLQGTYSAVTQITSAGVRWLVSADPFPGSAFAVWSANPSAPGVVRCGTAFDVINVPAVFGRRMLDRLWIDGPGSGPVAVHRNRMLLFAVPGTARRLPALLGCEEWGAMVPPLLCHGAGDAVTVPPLKAPDEAQEGHEKGRSDAGGSRTGPAVGPGRSRWLVAPDVRHPWLPGTEVLLWACGQAARGGPALQAASIDF
jgi:hypothetical protein